MRIGLNLSEIIKEQKQTIAKQQNRIIKLEAENERLSDMEFCEGFVDIYKENEIWKNTAKAYAKEIESLKKQLKKAVVPKFQIGKDVYFLEKHNWVDNKIIFNIRKETILYIEIYKTGISYYMTSHYSYEENELFATEEDVKAEIERLKGE